MRTSKKDGITYGGSERRKGVHGRTFIPTEEERARVTKLVQCGSPLAFIASQLNISITAVEHAFSRELADALWIANEKIVGAIQEAAEQGNLDAAKFWLSRNPQLKKRWSEKSEIGTEEGGPLIESIKVLFHQNPKEVENVSEKQ
jgi:hypothetical protein